MQVNIDGRRYKGKDAPVVAWEISGQIAKSFQKLLLFSSGYSHIISILHFNLSAITTDITFDIIEIDDMGMMRAEEGKRR